MVMEYRFPARLVWVTMLFFFFGIHTRAEAQGYRNMFEVVSLLQDSLSQARYSTDSARRALNVVLVERDTLKQERHRLREENRRLVFRLQDAENKARYMEQTNSMFVLYTGIAAVVFLFALLFVVVRKLASRPGTPQIKVSDQDIDRRIDRLNALGNLRERGLLTDQEVEEQKRFLIGGR